MKYLFLLITSAMFWASEPAMAVAPESCACEQVKCDPCMEQQGLDFYSSKCGPGGNKVKSCARPQCVPLKPLPARCVVKTTKKATRSVASTDKVEYMETTTKVGKKVATAQKIVGKVWVTGVGNQRLRISKGQRLHESDTLETEKSSSVKVRFDDGNVFNLSEESKLKIERVRHLSVEKKRQTILNLIKGKVRSKVLKKYKNAGSFYRVKTRSAVAGVRGTDFVVSFMQGRKEVTTVQTLTGAVQLMDKNHDQKRVVESQTKASFVIAANSSDVFEDNEIEDFIKKGYMTPVYKMSAAEISELDWSTRVLEKAARAVASSKNKKSSLCQGPAAEMDQCSWTCENNKSGGNTCRTDLPGVKCVRRRCNANGKWAEEFRVPASLHGNCSGGRQPVIGKCDY